ncbi:MAG: hypothetical protein KDD22_01470, partial [Bdellovibrionales bacterium]|nr:hypothetical protein [Bdellovibrionales bacterium]
MQCVFSGRTPFPPALKNLISVYAAWVLLIQLKDKSTLEITSGSETLTTVSFENFILSSTPRLQIGGIPSPTALAFFVAKTRSLLELLPQVFVFTEEKQAELFMESLQFFNSTQSCLYLPAFDVSPYSGLYPNHRIISQRLHWLYRAQHPKPHEIFVATVESLLQKTLPQNLLKDLTIHFRTGQDLPEEIAKTLAFYGYQNSPLVEDLGQFALRGGILDIFSPAHPHPLRLELFGDTIESIHSFDPETGRNLKPEKQLVLLPTLETLYTDENRQNISKGLREGAEGRPVDFEELSQIQRDVVHRHIFPGMEFLLPWFYSKLSTPLEHFSQGICLWKIDNEQIEKTNDAFFAELKKEFETSEHNPVRPEISQLYQTWDDLLLPKDSKILQIDPILLNEVNDSDSLSTMTLRVDALRDFTVKAHSLSGEKSELLKFLQERLTEWRSKGNSIFIGCSTSSQLERLKVLTESETLTAHENK